MRLLLRPSTRAYRGLLASVFDLPWLVDGPDLVAIIGQTMIYLVLLIGAGLFDLYRKNF